jgi:DNA-binding transcriptional MerR regulator
MTEGTLSIGAMARASGLSVSALRFYDTAGVLRPARVDPVTGYRWYDDAQVPEARLVAALRRVGMPLDDICEVLATRHDPVASGAALDRHLRRLEDGLADARRQLRLARDLLYPAEPPVTRLAVRAADLMTAIASVRFAAGVDPALPGLCGVLFDVEGDVLRLVASDRYRMAVATVPVGDRRGPDARAIAPLSLVDGRSLDADGRSLGADGRSLGADGDVELALDADSVSIGTARADAVPAAFPDYRRLTRTTAARRVTVTAPDLRARLAAGPTRVMRRTHDDTDHEVSVLRVAGGAVDVLDADHVLDTVDVPDADVLDADRVRDADRPEAIGFNREFLLEALDAGAADQLVLALDGPIRPLVITDPRRAGAMSLLMPVKLTSA